MMHSHTVHPPPGTPLIWCTVCGTGSLTPSLAALAAQVGTAYRYLPQHLAHPIAQALGSHPWSLLLALLVGGGALVAAAVPLTESSVLLLHRSLALGRTWCTAHTVHLPLGALLIWCAVCGYRSDHSEVRLTDRGGFIRRPAIRPGVPAPWAPVCDGKFDEAPSEMAELRRRRAHHGLVLGGALVAAAASLLRG